MKRGRVTFLPCGSPFSTPHDSSTLLIRCPKERGSPARDELPRHSLQEFLRDRVTRHVVLLSSCIDLLLVYNFIKLDLIKYSGVDICMYTNKYVYFMIKMQVRYVFLLLLQVRGYGG